ncbi:hypothetical protein [Leifsonia aquatica]|uniref:hypothetical protein n=1 Tax=Leifsonia aquatica TaxID=144185 RepID=UPI002009E1BD|nr:hypothetical protein [Leifsonia aquatica]
MEVTFAFAGGTSADGTPGAGAEAWPEPSVVDATGGAGVIVRVAFVTLPSGSYPYW